jgi:nitrogen fixation protein NifT
MKIMLHNGEDDTLMVYVPKKDLEETVVSQSTEGDATIVTLANGWELSINGLSEPLKLPKTVNAKRASSPPLEGCPQDGVGSRISSPRYPSTLLPSHPSTLLPSHPSTRRPMQPPSYWFNLDGTCRGFLGGDSRKPKSLLLEVDAECLAIKLPKELRPNIQRWLQVGDRVRCVGRSHIDHKAGVIKLKAYQVFALAIAEATAPTAVTDLIPPAVPASPATAEPQGKQGKIIVYYFAYGSCMCPVDLKRSLGESTHRYVIGPATLKHHRLGFHYYSAKRQCGALDILPDPVVRCRGCSIACLGG